MIHLAQSSISLDQKIYLLVAGPTFLARLGIQFAIVKIDATQYKGRLSFPHDQPEIAKEDCDSLDLRNCYFG